MKQKAADSTSKRRVQKLRRAAAALALVLTPVAGLVTGSQPASATLYTWSNSCANGYWGDNGALGSKAWVEWNDHACGVRTRVNCKNTMGSTQWQSDPTWRYLTATSYWTCNNGYKFAKVQIGYYAQT